MKKLIVFLALIAVTAFCVLSGQTVPELLHLADPLDKVVAASSAFALLPFAFGTTYKACLGAIKAENPSVPGTFVTIGEVTGWSLEESANIKSYFKLGDCNEQSGVTGISRSISIEGNFDHGDAAQDFVIPKIGDNVKLEVFPTGNTTGHDKYAITGVIESITRGGSGDDFVTFSANIKVNVFTPTAVP